MRRHFWLASAAVMAVAAACGRAEAGDQVLYEAVPNWVEDAEKLSEAEKKAEGLILLDEQQKVDEAGLVTCVDIAVHANSTQELAAAGTISMEWFPDKGDLVIHRLQILRDGQFVDIANRGKSFTVLHREKALEAQILDGRLTATMQVEGLKVGDVQRYSYSIRFKDPVLGGNVEAGAQLPAAPVQAGARPIQTFVVKKTGDEVASNGERHAPRHRRPWRL